MNKTAHPPLIDELTWAAVRQTFEKNRKKPQAAGAEASRKYLLSGLLKCGVCGGNFHTKKTPSRNGGWYYYYLCGIRQRQGPGACSNPVKIPHRPFDQRIVEAIFKHILTPELMSDLVDDLNNDLDLAAHRAEPGIRNAKRERAS